MKPRVVILADLPVWKLEGMEALSRPGTYATWFESLVPAFEELKSFDVHWVCYSKEVKCDTTIELGSQTFHILKRWKKSISMLSFYYWERLKITKKIRALSPDLIHAWGTEDVFGLAGSINYGIPKLFSIQGCISECLKNVDSAPFLMKLQAYYERITVKKYDRGTGESRIATDHLLKLHLGMEVSVVDYGVSNAFHEAKWSPSETAIVLFIGSITEAKGIKDFCEMADDDRFSSYRFRVIGSGELEEELKKKYGCKIEWVGRLDRAELVKELENSWALVLPTYADTGPSVVKEARVVGLPVITTDAAGASVYIEDGKSGFIVKPGDIEDFKEKLVHICKNKDSCILYGNYNHSITKSMLVSASTVVKFEKIYRNLLGI